MEKIDAGARKGVNVWLLLVAVMVCAYVQGHAQGVDDGNIRLIDIETDTLPDLNIARSGHVTLCLDGELTVLGGHTDGFVPTATAEYFHDGAWQTIPMAYPHDQGAVVRLRSGKVFLAGGHKEPLGIGQLYSVEQYDPKTHTSQGFACMAMKRAYANAIEMADGQVVITGNWFADDSIEMFEDVNNPFKTNAVNIKETSYSRATPYILRISDDDAIIFSSLDNHAETVDNGIVDRLKGEPYREPFLEMWHPIYTINIERSYNHFIGDEAEGRYEWLLPVENDEMGRVAIARVKGSGNEQAKADFSLLPMCQTLPDSIRGKKIVYSSLVCDRDREIAYLIGDNDEARIFVAAIHYNEPDQKPLTIYVTEPQPIIARGVTPVLTPEGDLVFAGGHLINNFSPTKTVIRLPLGQADSVLSADTAYVKSEKGSGFGWILIAIICICLVICLIAVVVIVKNRRSKQQMALADEPYDTDVVDDADLDRNLPKDETLAELFYRIEMLMNEEKLYLNPNLRASDVAALVGSNTAYVSAAINSQRGCSFTQFLATYRISHAQQLMRQNPGSKISSISAHSGFSTDSTFFRAFRAVTGLSPKEWLSAIRNEKK